MLKSSMQSFVRGEVDICCCSNGGLLLASADNGVLTPQYGSCASGVSNNSVASLFNSSLAGFE